MSQLSEFAAPEFTDRQLFRQFIALLREQDVISTNADEKLEFNEMIQQVSDDARYILSQEIRHGIIRVAPQVLRHPDPE
jgi:glycerol-3-phosphate O-acyltransferase